MVSLAKPLASLSSGLLARKGAARPAMRPQALALAAAAPAALDDLGWNDMGAPAAVEPAVEPGPTPVERPAVLVERDALAEAIEAPAEVASVSLATAARLQRETAHAGKAAFTLRVDADRHLRLRLASAIADVSAQALVTQALDALIASMPMVNTLAAQLPPPNAKQKGKRA